MIQHHSNNYDTMWAQLLSTTASCTESTTASKNTNNIQYNCYSKDL